MENIKTIFLLSISQEKRKLPFGRHDISLDAAIETLLRTSAGFIVLLILTRLLGKKQLGQLTIFTYITGVTMGNMAGDMVVHRDIRLIDGILGLALWALLTVIVELISLKFSKARVLLDGEPQIVIKKGIIMEKELASQRLNLDDLTMLLRINNIFSIKDVDYAILEPNGQLSVLKKPELESASKKDLQIKAESRPFIPTEIIVDGKLVAKNLKELNLSREWLDTQLRSNGIDSINEVLFAEVQSDSSLHITRKQSHTGQL